MFARFLLSGVFFALLAAPALATQVTIVTPNPQSEYISSIGNGGATVNFAGPTFQLSDDKNKPVAGATLTFSCSGPTPCGKMLSGVGKTDQFGRASVQFITPFSFSAPKAPPGRGAIIARYTVAATYGSIKSPLVTMQALCNGPFAQCIGTPTPTPTATPQPATTGHSGSGGGILLITDSVPIKGSVTGGTLTVVVHAKLLDSKGNPKQGIQLFLDLRSWGGVHAFTGADGIATLKVESTRFIYGGPYPFELSTNSAQAEFKGLSATVEIVVPK